MFLGARLARLSILFSIIRIVPCERHRNRLLFVAVAFIMMGILLICQAVWVCDPDDSWKQNQLDRCPLSKQVVILQIICEFWPSKYYHYLHLLATNFWHTAYTVTDVILMVAPVKVFRDLLDKGLRRRLILIFSASIMTTIVSLVHSVYICINGGIKSIIAGCVEVSNIKHFAFGMRTMLIDCTGRCFIDC